MSKKNIYEKYYQEQRRKLGVEPYEFEKTYLGSALFEKPDLKPHIDGEYLKSIIPARVPVKEDLLDYLEAKCLRLMENRASDTTLPPEKRKSCLFTIPEIIPGKSTIKPELAIEPLMNRLRKRGGLRVEPRETEEAYCVFISWN